MTADDATKLTADLDAVDPQQVDAQAKAWHQNIAAAAKAGKVQAFERDVPRLRMPITRLAHAAALDRLQADGFRVDRAADGEAVVSWPKPSAPPAVPTPDADPSR